MSDSAYDDVQAGQTTVRSRLLEIPNLNLLKKVGDGGMATVWKAWDTVNQRFVAVKVLNREFAADGAEVRAFRAEERIMEEIHHPASCRRTTSTIATATGTT